MRLHRRAVRGLRPWLCARHRGEPRDHGDGAAARPQPGVLVTGGAHLAIRATQRWSLTGLPEGTRLYAHFRRAGRTVARRSLARATDPCGRLSFDLPAQLGDASELWLTADRTFRRPRKGVFVRRKLTTVRSRAGTRVRDGELASRLAPLDRRQTSPITNGMAADVSRIGVVDLTFVGAAGATVAYFERVGDRLMAPGTAIAAPDEVLTNLRDATTWSCDRAERRFVASVHLNVAGTAIAARLVADELRAYKPSSRLYLRR